MSDYYNILMKIVRNGWFLKHLLPSMVFIVLLIEVIALVALGYFFYQSRQQTVSAVAPPLQPQTAPDIAPSSEPQTAPGVSPSLQQQSATRKDEELKELRNAWTNARSQINEIRTDLNSVSSQVKGLQRDVKTRFEKLTGRVDELSTKLGEELGETRSVLTQEREWFQRMQRLVEPRNTQQLILAGAGMSVTSPKRWSMLEKQWILLRGNPEFRARLLELWDTEPIQRIAAHYRRLIPLSGQQYAEERLAAGGMPPRLEHWYRLHHTARRNFVGVHNFFTRISRMEEPGFETFESSIRGMTHAEQEVGWAHVSDPPQANLVLAGRQFDDYVDKAKDQLLQAWTAHALRLHQELFDVARYERPQRALDELSDLTIEGDGIVEENVRNAGRLLGFDLIDIPLYSEVTAELSSFFNVRATQHRNMSEWLGYPQRVGRSLILRLNTLAWKRRQGSELVSGGAEVIVGKDADA
jgi:hypothetical protein